MERIAITCDEGSFIEYDKNMGAKTCWIIRRKVIESARAKRHKDGVISGRGKINGEDEEKCYGQQFYDGILWFCCFMRKLPVSLRATEMRLGYHIYRFSGQDMQEGIISLMQMHKQARALKNDSNEGLLYICYN